MLMKQVIHFKVRFLRENTLYWVYYGILTKTKVRECQHIGMSGGIGLFFACDLCNCTGY